MLSKLFIRVIYFFTRKIQIYSHFSSSIILDQERKLNYKNDVPTYLPWNLILRIFFSRIFSKLKNVQILILSKIRFYWDPENFTKSAHDLFKPKIYRCLEILSTFSSLYLLKRTVNRSVENNSSHFICTLLYQIIIHPVSNYRVGHSP